MFPYYEPRDIGKKCKRLMGGKMKDATKKTPTKLWDEVPGFDLNEEVDLPEMHSWFLDGTHSDPPLTPLYGYYWIKFCSHGLKYAADELQIPTCKGWEMRYHHGGSYNAFNIVRDPDEIRARTVEFQKRLRPWIEDFDGLWDKGKKEILGIYNNLKSVDLETATRIQLCNHHYDLLAANKRMWEIHFVGLYASFMAWLLAEEVCQERLGLKDTDARFQDMMRGYDNKVYEMDKRLWEFGKEADSMGLKQLFVDSSPDEIVARVGEMKNGRQWYKKFINYLENDEIGGWRMRRTNDLTEPYWLEDPAIPIGIIKDFMIRHADYHLDRTREQLAQKREATIDQNLAKIPSDEKPFFEGLVRLAGKASSYSQEHDLYCELMAQALTRRGYLAIGRKFAESGTIDRPEDIFMLNPEEIDRVIMVPETHDMRYITRRRRASWDSWQTRPNPPLITDRSSFDEAVAKDLVPSGDVIALKIVVGEIPKPKPELGADMFGLCGSPGEAEGPARIAIYDEDLERVQPGDIVVCPSAGPTWAPIFDIVSGIVTDRGGTLSHAANIGREYAVPTIVNTFEGTTRIKDGQRLRIDADKGAIFYLD
jgi:pyruvate,water dikinase